MAAASKDVIPHDRTEPQGSSDPYGKVGADDERWRIMIHNRSPEVCAGPAERLQRFVMLEERAGPADYVHSPSRGTGQANPDQPDEEPLTLESPRIETDAAGFAGRVGWPSEFETRSEPATERESRLNEPRTGGCVRRKSHARIEIGGRERQRRPGEHSWP
jgi:hypothetical protein